MREARDAGFDIARVTRPEAIGQAGDRLMTFLEEGRHGDMAWMETTADRRRDPRCALARGALHRHAGLQLRARH